MALTAATVGARNTTPAILVQLGSLRYSSRGDISWGGYTWAASGIALSDLSVDGTGRQQVSLTLTDTTTTWPALILAGLDADMACNLWLAYVAEDGTLEVQQEFAGVVNSADATTDGQGQTISIGGISEGPDVSWTPRISWLSPFGVRRGAEVKINNETYRLE